MRKIDVGIEYKILTRLFHNCEVYDSSPALISYIRVLIQSGD